MDANFIMNNLTSEQSV